MPFTEGWIFGKLMSAQRKRPAIGGRAAMAPFALLGAIVRRDAATMPIITPSATTAVMRVEAILRAPDSLGDLTGAEVTVELDGSAKVGQRLVLLADGWMYGESVAVREVARADPNTAEEIRARLVREQEELPVRHLSERLRDADMVVLGVVRELRPVERPDQWVPPSEHDPDWWVAVIAVEDVAKGRRPRSGRLEAVFANSRDVQWFSTGPKPDPGQDGVFLLRREQRFGAPKGALAVLDAADVQPRDHYGEIRRTLLGGD